MTVTTSKAQSAGFGNIFGGFKQSIENYRLYRQTVKELSNLTDRELSDLNISRWDIDRIAREAAQSR